MLRFDSVFWLPLYPDTLELPLHIANFRKQHLARDDGTVASQLLCIVITKLIVVLTSNQGPLYYKYNKEPQNSIGNYLETDRLRFKLNDVNEP